MVRTWKDRAKIENLKLIVQSIKRFSPELGADPAWILAIIGFETAGTYSHTIENKVSGAIGLIQFMPKTLMSMFKITKQDLLEQGLDKQLVLVRKYFEKTMKVYFKPFDFNDFYMAVLWPAAIKKPNDYVLFSREKNFMAYEQNKGLDRNRSGSVTKQEACYAASLFLPQAKEILEVFNEI